MIFSPDCSRSYYCGTGSQTPRPTFRRRFLDVAQGLHLRERLVQVGLSARNPVPRDETSCTIRARSLLFLLAVLLAMLLNYWNLLLQ